MTSQEKSFLVILRCSAPALLLAAALLAPFWNKAYTIDDPCFLAGARQVLRDPLHPGAFEMVWTTPYRLRASDSFAGGSLMYFLLAPVVWAGGAEWAAHLLQFLIFCGGICGTVSLALRLGLTLQQARWSGLLLAGTPAALALAGTAMPDVPSMTLGVWSMDRLVAWSQSRRRRHALVAAALLALAVLARSHLMVLAAVGAIALYEPGARKWAWRLWPLALALALAFAVPKLVRDPLAAGGGALGVAAAYATWRTIIPNFIAFLTHFVLVLPLALPWMLLRRRHMPWRLLWVLTPLAAVVFFRPRPAPLWTAPVAMLSVLVLADVLWDAWTRGDRRQLFLGAWLFLALPVLPYVHLPSKYLVASAPAVAILVALRIRRSVLAASVAAGALLGVLILQADARLAGLWRSGAAELIAPRVRAGERVWFAGSWGFYWYAERAGARPLSWTPPLPQPGDVVVVSSSCLRREIEIVPKYRVLEVSEDSTPGGRIFGGFRQAGFYANAFGYLPWTWGRDTINRFEVWRVE
jgi:hypothetical protein